MENRTSESTERETMSRREREDDKDERGATKRAKLSEHFTVLVKLALKRQDWKEVQDLFEDLSKHEERPLSFPHRQTTFLHCAATLGYAESVDILIENGSYVDEGNCDEWTALHFTAQAGHVDVAKVLLQNGADVNAVNENKSTALHIVALHG